MSGREAGKTDCCCGIDVTELFLISPTLLQIDGTGAAPVGTGSHLAGDILRYFPAEESFGASRSVLTSFSWEVIDSVPTLTIYWDESLTQGFALVQIVYPLFFRQTYYQRVTTTVNPVVLNQLASVTDGTLLPTFSGLVLPPHGKPTLAITYRPRCPMHAGSCSSSDKCGVPSPLSGNTQLFIIPAEFLEFGPGGAGKGEFTPIQLLGMECPLVKSTSWSSVDGVATLTVVLKTTCRVAIQLDITTTGGAFNQYLEVTGKQIVLNDIRNVLNGDLYPVTIGLFPQFSNLSVRPIEQKRSRSTDDSCKRSHSIENHRLKRSHSTEDSCKRSHSTDDSCKRSHSIENHRLKRSHSTDDSCRRSRSTDDSCKGGRDEKCRACRSFPANSEIWEISYPVLDSLPSTGGVIQTSTPQITRLAPTSDKGLLTSVEMVRTVLDTVGALPATNIEAIHFILTWPAKLFECCLNPVSIAISLTIWPFTSDGGPKQNLDFLTTGVPTLTPNGKAMAVTQPLTAYFQEGQNQSFWEYTKVAIRYPCHFR